MIYLDNAATTLRKPRAVDEAVRRAMHAAAGYARGGRGCTARRAPTALQARSGPARYAFPSPMILPRNKPNARRRSCAKP